MSRRTGVANSGRDLFGSSNFVSQKTMQHDKAAKMQERRTTVFSNNLGDLIMDDYMGGSSGFGSNSKNNE